MEKQNQGMEGRTESTRHCAKQAFELLLVWTLDCWEREGFDCRGIGGPSKTVSLGSSANDAGTSRNLLPLRVSIVRFVSDLNDSGRWSRRFSSKNNVSRSVIVPIAGWRTRIAFFCNVSSSNLEKENISLGIHVILLPGLPIQESLSAQTCLSAAHFCCGERQ